MNTLNVMLAATLAFLMPAISLASSLDAGMPAGCSESDTDWLAKRVDNSTGGRPQSAELVLYANGCVKATLPEMHSRAGVHWSRLESTAVADLVSRWETQGVYSLSKSRLAADRVAHTKAAGGEVVPTVWDSSMTQIELRHPRTKARTDAIAVYGLASQPAASKSSAWHALKLVGDDLLQVQADAAGFIR